MANVLAIAWFNAANNYLSNAVSPSLPAGTSGWAELGVNAVPPPGRPTPCSTCRPWATPAACGSTTPLPGPLEDDQRYRSSRVALGGPYRPPTKRRGLVTGAPAGEINITLGNRPDLDEALPQRPPHGERRLPGR